MSSPYRPACNGGSRNFEKGEGSVIRPVAVADTMGSKRSGGAALYIHFNHKNIGALVEVHVMVK